VQYLQRFFGLVSENQRCCPQILLLQVSLSAKDRIRVCVLARWAVHDESLLLKGGYTYLLLAQVAGLGCIEYAFMAGELCIDGTFPNVLSDLHD
jgi:hypothetical protein